jgi:hypothetical protein
VFEAMLLTNPSSKTSRLMEENVADQESLKQESVMFSIMFFFGQGRDSLATLPP